MHSRNLLASGFVALSGFILAIGGCGGDSAPVGGGGNGGGGGGNGGAPTVSPVRFDTAGWTFDPAGTEGIAVAGLLTPGGAKGVRVTSPTSSFTDLATPQAGAPFTATDMNSSKVVVGDAHFYSNGGQLQILEPYYWQSPTSKPTKLIKPAGVTLIAPTSISKGGAIVGLTGDSIKKIYYWASVGATPVAVPSPGNLVRAKITPSGLLTFVTSDQPPKTSIAAGPNAGRVAVTPPAGYVQVANLFEGDGGTLMGTTMDGPYLAASAKGRPVLIDKATGKTTLLPNPAGAAKVLMITRNAAGVCGGSCEDSPQRAVLIRNGNSVFFDTVAKAPAGVTLRRILRIFANGSALVEASDGRHYLYGAGSLVLERHPIFWNVYGSFTNCHFWFVPLSQV